MMIGIETRFNSGGRLWALCVKEVKEILRNKHLLFLLLIPPTVQLLILGASLDPQVRDLTLGVVDHARTSESRDLVDSVRGAGVFPVIKDYPDDQSLSQQLKLGSVDAGLTIGEDFSRQLNRRRPSRVKVQVDGTNAYAAGIASVYILRTIGHYRPQTYQFDNKLSVPIAGLERSAAPPGHNWQASSDKTTIDSDEFSKVGSAAFDAGAKSSSKFKVDTTNLEHLIDSRVLMMYNPGQVASWFFVPGVLGAALTLISTLVASAAVLRERESGTMDQLLVTPASPLEILLAKILPLTIFLLCDVLIAIVAAQVIFALPFKGSGVIFFLASFLYIVCGIGTGTVLGSLCNSQRQAQLASFFINIPLILLSGTVVPLDTMPEFLQNVSVFNPLRYYGVVARGIILKGVGWEILWPQLALLAAFAVLVVSVSALSFRRRLAA